MTRQKVWIPRIHYEIRGGFGLDRSMRTYTNQPPNQVIRRPNPEPPAEKAEK